MSSLKKVNFEIVGECIGVTQGNLYQLDYFTLLEVETIPIELELAKKLEEKLQKEITDSFEIENSKLKLISKGNPSITNNIIELFTTGNSKKIGCYDGNFIANLKVLVINILGGYANKILGTKQMKEKRKLSTRQPVQEKICLWMNIKRSTVNSRSRQISNNYCIKGTEFHPYHKKILDLQF